MAITIATNSIQLGKAAFIAATASPGNAKKTNEPNFETAINRRFKSGGRFVEPLSVYLR
jgi:hypothetical protein